VRNECFRRSFKGGETDDRSMKCQKGKIPNSETCKGGNEKEAKVEAGGRWSKLEEIAPAACSASPLKPSLSRSSDPAEPTHPSHTSSSTLDRYFDKHFISRSTIAVVSAAQSDEIATPRFSRFMIRPVLFSRLESNSSCSLQKFECCNLLVNMSVTLAARRETRGTRETTGQIARFSKATCCDSEFSRTIRALMSLSSSFENSDELARENSCFEQIRAAD